MKIERMSNLSHEIKVEFRKAQTAARTKQYDLAFSSAVDLKTLNPNAPDIQKFYKALVRIINAQIQSLSNTQGFRKAFSLIDLLAAEGELSSSTAKVVVENLRTLDNAHKRLTYLKSIAAHEVSEAEFLWSEIAECLPEIPTTIEIFNLARKTLRVIPGNYHALTALELYVDQANPDKNDASADHVISNIRVAQLEQRLDGISDYPDRKKIYDAYRTETLKGVPTKGLVYTKAVLSIEKTIGHLEYTLTDEAPGIPKPEEFWTDLQNIITSDQGTQPATASSPRHDGRGIWLKKVASLFLQSANREASNDRIGYLWLLVDPMFHVCVICAIPFFLHDETVQDMPVLPFGIIGACLWMVFRVASVGAMSGGGALKPQLEHPCVSQFDIIIARALHALIIYTLIGSCLMAAAITFGYGDLPQNLLGVVVALFCAWFLGTSYGTIAFCLIESYAGFRRINGFILRFLGLTSGLFYTSEQLPEEVAHILLLNPLLHVIQIARSFWFHEYSSKDASPTYVSVFVGLIILVSLFALLRTLKKPAKVRV
ncbi:ABC transporter permease [Cognatishimia sp. 1_MG-2023]|uniref:ABC transporter permease n=1 Tax=Cognatishimia sp. 1_MG-2023 TaxID=3062642 RepID=UPI0026E27178|nr:ABC transporter permease [Cognatishimia sp. 1_MG-2023]MDO6728345.1 ABC transporter permease [Cognatishimia sp. 1_MG-2023]